MKSLRLVTLLLLPLLAPTFMAEQPSSVSYAQARGPVRFPSAVAPRNDIQMQNRVPVRMRDGVTLYADVYRPAERGSLPGHRLENPVQHRTCALRVRRGGVLRPARLRLRLPGHSGPARVRWRVGSVPL